jgi:hypothetical protein
MNNKLYEQYDDESIEALNTIDILKRDINASREEERQAHNTIDRLLREVIELQAEIATLKAQMRDMG